MRQIFKYFFLSLLFFVCSFASDFNLRDQFVDEKGNLTENIITLLKLDNIYSEGDNLASVQDKIITHWVASGAVQGKEHTDVVDSPEREKIRPEIIKIASSLGLFDEQKPSLQHYDYAICLGSFLDSVRNRLTQLVKLWQLGIRFDSLIFLTGERYLRKGPGQKDDYADFINPAKSPLPFKSNWSPLPSPYETEYDMCMQIFEQVEIPQDMQKALENKVIFVNAPKGEKTRPNTKDTYVTWIETYHPVPGTVLASSDPLFFSYQHLGAVLILDETFVIDTVAPRAPYLILKIYEPSLATIVLDVIAKCLIEIHKTAEQN